VPEVRPPLVPRQEEEMCSLRVRCNYYAPKIFVAEQEDQ